MHITAIPLEQIRPAQHQARKRFDPQVLAELANSMRESGVISPIVVRTNSSKDGSGYRLLAGERRWRAAQLAGLATIPAIVRDDLSVREAAVLGLIENLQRESLSPMETAHGLRELGEDFKLTQVQIADKIGKSRVYVTHFLRLLALHPQVQTLLDDEALSMGHAKVLCGLPTARQVGLAQTAIKQGWSVRQLEKHANAPEAATPSANPWASLEQQLAETLGNAVKIEFDADKGRGFLRVQFHSLDELDGIVAHLQPDTAP